VGQGAFITFEGGEGAGKSTQIERLSRRLKELPVDVVVTREPGGSPKAERIRRELLEGRSRRYGALAEALLFCSARMDHLATIIRPALESGAVVLCDRFSDSTRAYQGARGAVDETVLKALERVIVEGTRPDLTFILDIPSEIGLARAAERRGSQGGQHDRFEAEEEGFHRELRNRFRAIAEAEPDRCALIDASLDQDAVEQLIWKILVDRPPAALSKHKRWRRAP